MRAVVQRVREARVDVGGAIVGRVGHGLVAFVAVGKGDTSRDVEFLADKIAGLRVFPDATGKMALAVGDVGGGLLVVSQFTLYGDVSRGLRPSFDGAMLPPEAERLYDALVLRLRCRVADVATGKFGADMRVAVDNDGPVTLLLESPGRTPA